ncbi:MAG TPA: VOC family protein [Gaiellaceae bacterium]|nr:VOC family protein [Gaiellaceae bacterium]
MSTVETAVGRFVWHDHLSADPEAARRFYGELLGWETEIASMGEFDYPMIKVGAQTHGGFGPAQGGAPAHWLGHVLVDDADDAVRRVEAAGGTVIAPAMDIPDIGRWAVGADPQGAVVSLFAAAGGPTSGEGVFVWDELMTTDVEAAKRYYGEVVGWDSRDMDMGNDFVYTIFSSGGADRAGGMPIPPQAEGNPPAWMTYLGTDDIDATAEKARSLGAMIMQQPWDVPTVGRLAILVDPTGAVVGLFKPEAS